MKGSIVFAVMTLSFVNVSQCYSTGANPSACIDREMKPSHRGGTVKNDGTYTIKVIGKKTYKPGGDQVNLNIEGVNATFKGFLVLAKSSVNQFDIQPKGEIKGAPVLVSPICGEEGHGATHTEDFSSTGPYRKISLSWTPPTICSKATGNIRFQASVVKSFESPAHINIFSEEVVMVPRNRSELEAAGCFNGGFSVTMASRASILQYFTLFTSIAVTSCSYGFF